MKSRTRRILFPLAGAALGMLAGAGFSMDKGMVEGAAFFGFVGLGLGYALHDFNWRRNRKTGIVLALVFLAPGVALTWLMVSHGVEKAVSPSDFLSQVAVVWEFSGILIAPGGLLTLLVYAVANFFDLIEEARGWPARGVADDDGFWVFKDDDDDHWITHPDYSWWGHNVYFDNNDS